MRLFLLTALTMTAFAANSVLNRAAVGAGLIDPTSFALIRVLAGAVVLAGLVVARRVTRARAVWPGGQGRMLGVLSLLLYLFGFSLAYGALDAGAGALILFGMVQITMFAGALIAREAVPGRRWAGAALAFAGLVYLLAPGSGSSGQFVHAGMMALAGIGWGLYSLAAREASDPLGATAWNFILATPLAFLIVLVLPTGQGGDPAALSGIVLAVLSGTVTSGLGYALWYRILPGLGAARAGVAQLTVPVIAVLGGMIFLGEALTLRFALASLLVLGGVALAVRPLRQS